MTAEHEEPASSMIYKVCDHPELVWREMPGLNAAQNQALISEQLGARAWKATNELIRPFEISAIKLVLSSPLEQCDPEVLVVLHAPQQKFDLPAWLAFEIQDLLASIFDHHQRFTHVVLRDHLV
jgi:hypothetical protein